MMKKLIILLMFVLSLPVVLADSVFSNPAFDTILLLLFAAIIFFIAKSQIDKIK